MSKSFLSPLSLLTCLTVTLITAELAGAQTTTSKSERLRRTDWVEVSAGTPSVQLSSAKEMPSGRSALLIKTVTEIELSEIRAQVELSPKTSSLVVLDCFALRRRLLKDPNGHHESVWRCDGEEGFVEQFLSDRHSKLSLFLARSSDGITNTLVVQPGRVARQALSNLQ